MNSIEKHGGKVFALATAIQKEHEGKGFWQIICTNPTIGRNLLHNLSGDVSDREGLHQFQNSIKNLTYALLSVIEEQFFPEEAGVCKSRMDETFRVACNTIPNLVFGQIARGGDRPTFIAKEYLEHQYQCNPIPRLHAASQRKGERDAMDADVTVKGRTELKGKTLLILEQAVATVTTIPKALREWIRTCESKPDRVIVGAIHTSHESLTRLQNMGNPDDPNDPLHKIQVDVVAALLHNGINEKGYLTGPGCGDVGAKDAGLPD